MNTPTPVAGPGEAGWCAESGVIDPGYTTSRDERGGTAGWLRFQRNSGFLITDLIGPFPSTRWSANQFPHRHEITEVFVAIELLGLGFGKGLAEELPVPVIKDDRFPPFAPRHDMVDGILILDARGPWHGGGFDAWENRSRNVALRCH